MTALLYLLSFLSGAFSAWLAYVILRAVRKAKDRGTDELEYLAIVRY